MVKLLFDPGAPPRVTPIKISSATPKAFTVSETSIILILDSIEGASFLFCLFVYGANSLMMRFLLQSFGLQHLHILVASTRNLDFI